MKQIYNFEENTPPALNERILLQKAEEKKLRLQALLIAAAVILIQTAVLLVGIFAAPFYPILTVMSLIYVIVTATGCGVIAVVFTKKEVL